MKGLRHNATVSFVLPVMFENFFNTAAGLVFSWLIGGISASALTTIATGNQVINLITAAATMLVTGSGILCARLLGAGDKLEASKVVEQTTLLTVISSTAITVLCLIFAAPLMTLLMPNAEAAVLHEGISFFRVLILSLPATLLFNMINSVLRASGDGRSPMIITFTVCGLQLLFAWLLLRVLRLEIMGAGLCYLLSRLGGTAVGMIILLRSHQYFIRLKNILRADFAVFRRILAVGIPTSIESIFIQTGYLVGNSMVIGLGTFEAAVYNVANTLYTFAAFPQAICSSVAMTIIGQLIGAKEYGRAKRTGWSIWAIGMTASFILSSLILILRGNLTPIYSADPAVQAGAAYAVWSVFVMCIPAISLNAIDPQLRVGGDVKFVMIVTIIAVWIIRLPLTYLFCYVWDMGAPGVFWANTICLFFRVLTNTIRFIQGKYLYMRV